jgi:hypothetical protein
VVANPFVVAAVVAMVLHVAYDVVVQEGHEALGGAGLWRQDVEVDRGALLGLGLRLTNFILTWTPSAQTISKQGVTAPVALQFGRPAALLWPAAWTGEAAAKTSVRQRRLLWQCGRGLNSPSTPSSHRL